MKKIFVIPLTLILLTVGILSGCTQKKEVNIFKADNEIYTYQKIDASRTQLVVSRTGNIAVEPFCKQFELQNPDIQVIFLDITGGDSAYKPLVDWIQKGAVPDVIFSTNNFLSGEMAERYLENLGLNTAIQNYETAALQRTAINGNVYWLPGPSDINAIMYNKTLFLQYGWNVPKTFDEFITLCDKIKQETNGEVEAWNPNAKYTAELLKALEGFTYTEIFGGVENRTWYNNFVAGNGHMEGHMEPFMEVIETLAEHDILREEHFSYSATTRGREFSEGKIAMINMNIYNADNDNYDFGYMPYPSTSNELGYICDNYSCYVGIPKKVHTDKEQDAINRFIAYFSSAEGQETYIGKSLKVSNVKNVNIGLGDPDLSSLQSAITAGNKFAEIGFTSTIGKTCVFSLHQNAIDITKGTKTGAECIRQNDLQPYAEPSGNTTSISEVVASVDKDMTILETSFYMADSYRKIAEADIGLIENNEAYRGNLMKFFKGDINADMVTVFKPRSLANNSKLIKVSMTGQQLLDAMNNPLGYETKSNCIYAFSGLTCEVAPWNEIGTKYLSVKLSDGTALETDTLYSVAIWEGTVAEEYITEVLETYEGTWEKIMTDKMKADKTITAVDVNRIKLIWD